MADQVVSINFSQGLDTKTTDKLVIAGKMTTLRDAVFSAVPPSGKQLNKRNGYDSMTRVIENSAGTLTNPRGIASFRDEVVVAAVNSLTPTQGRLFSYSMTSDAWVDKGKYQPVKNTNLIVSSDNPAALSAGCQLGNYTITSWYSFPSGGVSDVYVTVLDSSNNVYILPELKVDSGAISAGSGGLAVKKLSSTEVGIYYAKPSAGNLTIYLVILTITGSTATLGAPITLKTDSINNTNSNEFAVAEVTGGNVVAYRQVNSGTGVHIVLFLVDASGAITTTASFALASSPIKYFSITVGSTGNIWLYLEYGSSVDYSVWSPILVNILPNVNTGVSASAFPIFAREVSTTSQILYYAGNTTLLTGGDTSSVSLTSTGTIGTPALVVADSIPYAATFTAIGNSYLVLYQALVAEASFYVIDLFDNRVVAKFLSGRAGRPFGCASGGIVFNTATSVTILAQYLLSPSTSAVGNVLITLDFDHRDLYQALQVGENLIWNGSVLTQYDGQAAVELGFLFFPSQISAVAQTSGGQMADGTYQYFAVYQWFDNKGNLYQSAPSVGLQVVVAGGGGLGSVDLVIPTLTLTGKQAPSRFPVQIAIYRTLDNQTIPHSIGNASLPLLNDVTVPTVNYTDTQDDISIESNAILYTTGGVLENTAPPSATIMTLRTNRLWVVDDESGNTIWPTKTFEPGVGLAFSDLQTEQVDERGGPITALGAMDDKLIIFKETIPFFSTGDVGNDAGQGSTFTIPQPILSDVGCTASKSVVIMPTGLIRKTDKGLYLLDRSLNDTYIGFDVEQFNTQNVVSALIVIGKNQVRFLTDSGYSLLYDYFYGQWSTFSNHQGYGATLWNGLYVYVRTDGKIFKENTTSFLDDTTPYAWYGQTAWMKTDQIQGFERFKKALYAGQYANGSSALHGMQVQIAYDYVPTFSNPVLKYFSQSPNTSGLVQYLQFPQTQKCEAFQLLIQELVTGVSGENLALTDLAIEVMIKKGPFKLPAVRSVG